MGNENIDEATWQQKLLFYITAFFVLLGIFSLFSFLFLVPFVIDPAFTTIFMEFDEEPALCVTVKIQRLIGASNCSWTSCREGCTKDIYDCLQIFVTYKIMSNTSYWNTSFIQSSGATIETPYVRQEKNLEDYDYEIDLTTGLQPNTSEWFYKEARLLPNVKGCGYPPILNCSVWLKNYTTIGSNFTCYYSKIEPGLVISDLNMWQVYMNLVYAMCIPIPSFIISVIYLAFAYFKIYTDDEEAVPLEKNAEAIDVEGENEINQTPIPLASGGITPGSEAFREDIASFGHHFKVAMVDDISRDSLVDGVITSVSIGGSVGKAMTTSILTTGGPVADI